MLQSFKELPITLGSGPDATFKLDNPLILGSHAQIFFSRDSYWVKDLTGKNLITINSIPIQIQSPLSPEDRLSLTPQGPVFRFLAGGRLAESDEILPDPVPPDVPSDPQDPPVKKSGSFFSKFLK